MSDHITLDSSTLDTLAESPEEMANFLYTHAHDAPGIIQAFTSWVCSEDAPAAFTEDQCATVSVLVGLAYLRLGLFGLPEGAEVRDFETDEPAPEHLAQYVLLSQANTFLQHAWEHGHPIAYAMADDTTEDDAHASAVGWVLEHMTIEIEFSTDDAILYL